MRKLRDTYFKKIDAFHQKFGQDIMDHETIKLVILTELELKKPKKTVSRCNK